ncbi:hypothetical protein EDD22DRAFT_954822 [Suillus occidentalis]|nr:hypothetical protein EDD22DRAFT_954822 [Suillus occidentalis]
MASQHPPRFACISCPDSCAEFTPMNDSPNSTCFCLHTYSDHHVTQALLANLPPKGGCVTSNCLMFRLQNQGPITVQSVCICGKGWLAHANLCVPSVQAPVQAVASSDQPADASHEAAVDAWAPPQDPQSRPFQLANQSGRHNTSSDTSIVFKAIFMPYPISSRTLMIESDEPLPSQLKLSQQKLPDLYQCLNSYHLIIEMTLTDSATLKYLDERINSHFSLHNISFPPSPYVNPHPGNGSPQYEKLRWSILELGKLSVDQNSTLLKKTATTMKNPMDNTPLLFIAPRFGMLRGPISCEPADTHTHFCFAARVMDTFFTETVPEPSRDPTCFHSCPEQSDDSSNDSFDDELPLSVSELAVRCQELPVPHPIRPAYSATHLWSSNSLIGTSSLRSNILHTHSHTWRLLSTSGAQPRAATSPPPPAIIDLTRDHPAFPSVVEWLDYAHTHAPTESETVNHWRLFAPSVKSAALALIAFVEAQCSWVPLNLSDAKFEGAQVGYEAANDGLHMNISSLFMSDCTYIVGPGVGSGIECAVLSQAISMVFGDLHMWSATNNEGYKCPSIVPFASDTSHLHWFKAHGILCALHIFHLGQPPLPCSPFLLCHAIWGFNDLINPAFVELLAPETAASLTALPLDPMQPLDLAVDGSLASLLATYSNIQLSQLPSDISAEQREELVGAVYATVLLGCPPGAALDMVKDLVYFCHGFDVAISDAIPSFCALMHPSSKTFLSYLYNQRITSPAQVIDRLAFEVTLVPGPSGDDIDIVDIDTENAFILKLTHYLWGKGHPNHPLIAEYIPEDDRMHFADSAIFRCEQLLLMVCGNCCLPSDAVDKITFHFVKSLPKKYAHTRPVGADEGWEPISPLQVQSSAEVPEDDDIVTPFDVWVHLSLFSFSSDGPSHFNAA